MRKPLPCERCNENMPESYEYVRTQNNTYT